MHDVLRQRLMRRIDSLPEEQVYQVLDFIEFLESKYARDLQVETTGIQRFAEGLEDKMRKKAMNPATLREAFQLIAAADRALSSVSAAGRQILTDLGSLGEGEEATPRGGGAPPSGSGRPGGAPPGPGRPGGARRVGGSGSGSGPTPGRGRGAEGERPTTGGSAGAPRGPAAGTGEGRGGGRPADSGGSDDSDEPGGRSPG